MATNDDWLSLKDKPKGLVDKISGDQYSNLNLNKQNIHCVFEEIFHPKSVASDSKKFQNYDFSHLKGLQAKKDSNSWKKSNKHLSKTILHLNHDSKEIKEFKNAKSANCSTLSLHIAAYENSIEAKNDSDGFENEVEALSMPKQWGTLNNHYIEGSTSIIQNPFEFPRQQNDQANRPELIQFAASQRLLNPNQMDSNIKIKPPPSKPKMNGRTKESTIPPEDGPQKTNFNSNAFKVASFDRPKSLQNRKLIALIRNGERIDRVFPEWLNLNFTDTGKYLPTDLNQPIEMLQRSGGVGDYLDDSPITEIGGLTSHILGRSFRLHDIWPLQKIFCSPSLRCVQSSVSFVKGLNKDIKICIEPGLFDWTKWYKAIPKFLSIEELVKTGYPIDTEYIPSKNIAELEVLIGQETIDEFYARIRLCLSIIASKTPEAARIAVISHATSIDASIKALRHCPPRTIIDTDMAQMGMHYPYSTIVMLAQDRNNWSFVHQPVVPLSYLGISNKSDVKFINSTTRAKDNLKYEA